MQAVRRRRLHRDPEEAAIVIQSTWRMKQAQVEVSRLKQQQEAQLQAAADLQVTMLASSVDALCLLLHLPLHESGLTRYLTPGKND